ncbi:alpha/beta fold hydrolase [Phytohabitans sp. ZYX-F-186]|uniref:Alpha/beta fold hydrolase n=1 Tax=Phytohabitans maris TaxID=3071409 RepID=A0ABU0Z7G4_9ACTN|nr:AMP-binding protein [Phytohabitans sp. ZYX-F-186]MDQ7903003.1 alpha/beta fold hydrolase [Phytohabitans sp. ZYX-F-186]
MNNNIVEHLLSAGKPDATAYVDAGGQVTYAELARAVHAYAARLDGSAFRPGSNALIVADDSIATVVAILGVWWAGGVPVPVSPMLTPAEIEFIAGDCSATYLHVDERAEERFPAKGALDLPRGRADRMAPYDGEIPPPAHQGDGDVVLIQYTSGSTGQPKGVLHTRAGIDGVLSGFGRILALSPADTVLSTAKLSFGYGFGNSLLFPLAAGARTVLSAGPPDVFRVAATLAAHRPTVLCSVPRVYAALLERIRHGEALALGSLRLAVSAGEHLPAPMCGEFARVCSAPLVNGLGATEVLHIVVATNGSRPGSTGIPVPGVRITVRDDQGQVVPDGVEGRLHVAGGSVAAGYLDRADATARTFADGGAYTGDIVRRAVDGDLEYVCRRDDLINVGGFKVSPFEVEAAAREVDGLSQVAVVGARDTSGLEQAVAYLVPENGVDRAVLRTAARQAFRDRLPVFKRPAVIEVVDQLPVTSTGKLARFKLRTGEVNVTLRVLREGRGGRYRRTLICLPYAGGSAGSYTRLAKHLPESWRVVAGEASLRGPVTVADVADAWWKAVTPYLSAGTVLFGHSLGALVAAEVANRAGAGLEPAHVVLSAPPLSGAAARAIRSQDDAQLVADLTRSGLMPPTTLTADEVGRLLLPRFRRDLSLVPEEWTPTLETPVHVLVGAEDTLCTLPGVAARLRPSMVASTHVVDGGHYFVVTNPVQTAAVLAGLYP